MKVKDYLGQLEKLDALIDNKLAEKDFWWSKAINTTPTLSADKVQSSSNQQKMMEAADRHMALEAEIDAYVDKLIDTKKEIIKTIELLNATEYDLLHKVYIQKWEFKDYAVHKKKSYSWVTTVHGRALQHLQKILNERESK